jgi:hypothetical protein
MSDYTNKEILDRIEKATKDKDKLPKVGLKKAIAERDALADALHIIANYRPCAEAGGEMRKIAKEALKKLEGED